MRRLRIALLRSAVPTPWLSCRTIGDNLRSSYRATGAICRDFEIVPEASERELKSLVSELAEFAPDQISFTDYYPHATVSLKSLLSHWPYARPPQVNIHVYGDFVLYAHLWGRLGPAMCKLRIRWLCPSPRHATLLRILLKGSPKVFVCPFPVDVGIFRARAGVRERERHRLRLKSDEQMLLYTGRISLQKNILLLIEAFRELTLGCKTPRSLHIVGRVDERGAPYLGRRQQLGEYDLQILAVLRASGLEAKQIRFHDYRSHEELALLYNAADSFVSLSTYHDEDYGMSPAEALCCGTPAALTRWGGFTAFADAHESVQFAPVQIDRVGILLDANEIQKAIEASLRRPQSTASRRLRSEAYAERLSITAVAARLSEILRSAPAIFAGFNLKYKMFVQEAEGSHLFDSMGAGSVYHKLYAAYFEQNEP